MIIKQISLFSLLLLTNVLYLNGMLHNANVAQQKQFSEQWATFVRTSQYLEQVGGALERTTQKVKKYESPETITGYEGYQKVQLSCKKYSMEEGHPHPKISDCICSNAYNKKSVTIQLYINAKCHENYIQNVLADLIDSGCFQKQ